MKDLFPKVNHGKLFVISAPSGTGKTTLVSLLLQRFPGSIARAVTCTTRLPREGEREGVDYYFLNEETFQRHKEKGDFLETVKIYGYEYGTLRQSVLDLQNAGKHVLLVIDVQGAAELRGKLETVSIFICPPSYEELERRIHKRKQDSSELIKKRLIRSRDEMEERFHYDYILTNDDEMTAYEVLKSIIVAETYRYKHE